MEELQKWGTACTWRSPVAAVEIRTWTTPRIPSATRRIGKGKSCEALSLTGFLCPYQVVFLEFALSQGAHPLRSPIIPVCSSWTSRIKIPFKKSWSQYSQVQGSRSQPVRLGEIGRHTIGSSLYILRSPSCGSTLDSAQVIDLACNRDDDWPVAIDICWPKARTGIVVAKNM